VSSADLATLARCLRAAYERRTESTDRTPRWLPAYLSSPPEASTAGVKVSARRCALPGPGCAMDVDVGDGRREDADARRCAWQVHPAAPKQPNVRGDADEA
jgi:hypothetical protein